MPLYLHQFKYKDTQIRRMLDDEETSDRESTVRAAARAFHGELHGFYFCFGRFDGVAITEFPDQESALACAMAIFGEGRTDTVETTPLISMNDGTNAIRLAQSILGRAGRPAAGT
jgi:uncharacterized protein with GYD domain